MNRLIIGMADKAAELHAKRRFLLIDDGPICDEFLAAYPRAKEFIPTEHSFNPLPMTYRNAREFAAVVFGEEGNAQLGEHDARILGSLLISQYKGQIIVPDFGFYARPFHTALVRENRLIAGVFTLSDLEPPMRRLCLLMEKVGLGCTYEDAEVLARY